MPFFAAGLVVILAMVGLALDLGHAYVNKTRLQNAIDAATLSAAKTLDQNKLSDFATATAAAEAAAHNTFTLTLAEDGNQYVNARIEPDDLDIEFFDELEPLTPAAGVDIPRYVRVRNNSGEDRLLVQATWFIQILPGVGNELAIGGSAMAGPSPSLGVNGGEVCNVFPIMICSCEVSTDPLCGGGSETFGYSVGQEIDLKHKPGENWEVGPGNFKLLRIGGSGASVLEENLAGKFSTCIDSDGDTIKIDTEPGSKTGPVSDGINPRFGKYRGSMNKSEMYELYPPDANTCYNESGSHYTHAEYVINPSCIGTDDDQISGIMRVPERRIITVPVADCSPTYNGHTTIPFAGFACLFLTRSVPTSGVPAHERIPRAEILAGGCAAQGSYGLPDEGEAPTTGPGPYKIILYADPESSSG